MPLYAQAQNLLTEKQAAACYSDRTDPAHAALLISRGTNFLFIKQDINDLNKLSTETKLQYETAAREQENQHLRAEKKKQDLTIRHHQVVMALGTAVLILLLVLLAVLHRSRRRGKTAYKELQQAHQRMQAQQKEIILQKNELMTQSAVLRAQNEELEQHKQFRTKIFSIISHDLRTPFNSINSVLRLVLHKSMDEGQMKRVFGLLSRDVKVATDMLQNLLVWSQAQLEDAHVRLEPVNLQQLVQENITFASVQAAEKKIQLLSNIGQDAVVHADREMLNFVLRNLLMNAVKFTYESGQIEITVCVQETRVTIAVRDNGKGIPSKYIPKLFTEERVTTPGTQNEKGTGLGLMLCREFVESQNGSIRAESEEGKGSVFSICLERAAGGTPIKEETADLLLA
ncbi:hypothetical protein GCM10023188_28580 [Pontibacter saemangeumensis]|uniref:histidine kinase n=1 Tax=Pontibacter saemangeumensis TaxID=1084525 RepID=A0ABP8LUT9_9BACT